MAREEDGSTRRADWRAPLPLAGLWKKRPAMWSARAASRFCNWDEPLIAALHEEGFEVAIETNGTKMPPADIDWICVSPKAGAELVLKEGDELKLVYPQEHAPPEAFTGLPFRHFFLQPMDGPDLEKYTKQTVAYCLAHPMWRLSLQTHKLLGIP